MTVAASKLIATKPDTIVVISPHTPRHRGAFGLLEGYHADNRESTLQGDFGDFGYDGLTIKVPWAEAGHHRLFEIAKESGLPVQALPPLPLDHGAMVPLHFVQLAASQANWHGGIVLVSLPYYPTSALCRAFGEAIAKAAHAHNERWAILASGDMSHRLTPDAPAGFHANGLRFDTEFTKRVRSGDYESATLVDDAIRESAAEDVVDSFEIAASAVKFNSTGHEVHSYEGPFGVGYLIATLHTAAHTEAK
jgi:aromatic ring-opening dioxygenase LigB subunit